MTKKEALHYETIQIQNEIRTIQGKAEENINLDTYVETLNFKKYADRRTKAELEKELAIAQEALRVAKEKKAVADWKESEAGQAYIKERSEKIDAIRVENRSIIDAGRAHASEVIRGLLGDQWDVTRFSDGNMEVAIVEKYLEDGRPVGLFGHEFEVNFGHNWMFSEDGVEERYCWSMNYGTMGSFNLNNDTTRVQHVIGMGKFASDTEVVPQLKDYLQKMSEKIYHNHKVIYGLEKEIKNPVIG